MSFGVSIYYRRRIQEALAVFLNIPFAVFWILGLIAWMGKLISPYSALTWMGIGMAISAWLLLAIAKWAQIKRLDIFKWGTAGLSPENKRLYALSYVVMVMGLTFMFSSPYTDFLSMNYLP